MKNKVNIARTFRAFSTLVILALFASSARAQVAVAPLELVRQQFLSSTGVPLAAGCLTFNATGTSTPQPIYTDSSGLFQAPNPYQLDAAGESNIWLSNTGYDLTAYAGVNNTACSVALGAQLWQQKNINPFSIINGGSNYIVASGTVDPSGSAGMLAYRTDIPCFRGFTTIWDCFLTLTAVQAPINKTIDISANTLKTSSNVAGHYPRNNGTQYVDSAIQTGDVSVVTQTYPNNGAGTSTNLLTGFFTTGFNAVSSLAAPATQDAIGVCVGGCGTTGTATLITYGQASCVFDNISSAGDYVTTSATTIGNCHDAGATYPVSTVGQIVGRVVAGSSVPAGLNTIVFFGAELKPISLTVTKVDLGNQGANITSTPLFTPTANGFYRLSCYLVVSQAATSTSTLPTCGVLWTDADTSTSESVTVTGAVSTNTVGTISIPGTGTNLIYAKSGVAISYQTAGYATSGATSMQYALHLRLEGPF